MVCQARLSSIGIQLADLPVDITKRLMSTKDALTDQIDLLVDRKQVALDTIEQIEDARCRALADTEIYQRVQVGDDSGYDEIQPNWIGGLKTTRQLPNLNAI